MTKLTVSEKLEDKVLELEAKTDHSLKLFYALEGHPEEFSWNGEILELEKGAKCACGHPIRNGFPLVHKNDSTKQVIVGCICVDNAPGMTEELITQMKEAKKALLAKIAAAKKAEKELLQDSEIVALSTKREELKFQAKKLREEKGNPHVSYGYWQVCAGRYPFRKPESYKQKSAAIKKLKEDVEFLERCLAEIISKEN